MDVKSILIVCTANICRSPIAEIVLRTYAMSSVSTRGLRFKSAGTHATKSRIDPRARAVLAQRGYGIGEISAKRIVLRDVEKFDLVVAMDHANIESLKRLCPRAYPDKIKLFLDFAPGMLGQEIPDPYYGNIEGFEKVLDLCELAALSLLAQVLKTTSRDISRGLH